MLKTRQFEDKDAGRVSIILIAAFKSFLLDKFDDLSKAYFEPEEIIARVTKGPGRFSETIAFVAEDDGKVIGYIEVTAGKNGLGMLDIISVDPEFFSKGVGNALMAQAEKFWAEHNQRKIATCVSAHNTKALIYYIKNGFIPEGYQKNHFHEGVDEIILGRFL
ncbi:MAG: GNAT family N-acetyltransferase [Kiritimatiellae bacterium]|nr:GNAT family N-acetyltransferase [Verrucomicrobiota bacterium]MCG2660733.1 GNAT family N-acetyltransferase [Kiritimatiellia bacterium]